MLMSVKKNIKFKEFKSNRDSHNKIYEMTASLPAIILVVLFSQI
jgi:hypothetical protein